MKMKKSLKIFLCAVGSFFAAVILFALIVGHCVLGIIPVGEPEAKYNSVLKTAYDNNPSFGELPVTKIALLGSHDALSYAINYNSPPNSSEDVISNNAALRFVGQGAIVRYSKAQKHDIYTQMNCGVRYIDARITNIDGEYYTSHGLVSHRLEESLTQILRFLSENPGEYAIFHIVHYYRGQSDWASLCAYIAEIRYNGKNLYDFVNYDIEKVKSHSALTYNMMTSGGTSAGALLIMSESMTESPYNGYFKLSNIDSKWHNKAGSDNLKRAVEEHYGNLPEDNSVLRVNQAQTTPTGSEIWATFSGWSLLDMAATHNLNMLNSKNFDNWLDKMPVYMCDFSTSAYGDFNNRINAKILAHNLNLK